MGILFAAVLVLLIGWLCNKWNFLRLPDLPGWVSPALWGLKLMAAGAVAAVYTWYYPDRETADIWKYFDDAMTIRSWWETDREIVWRFFFGTGMDDPNLQPYFDQLSGWTHRYTYGLTYDSPTMIRLHLLISVVSGGAVAVHVVLFAAMSFIGQVAIYRSICHYFSGTKALAAFAVFLLPSVWFWSSGMLKEAPLFLFLGLVWLNSIRLTNIGFSTSRITGLFVGLCGMIAIKEYVLICLLPGLIFLFVARFFQTRTLTVFVAVHGLLFLLALNADTFFSAGDLIHILSKKREDFYNVAALQNAASTITIPEVTSAWTLIIHYPRAFALTWLRPFPWEMTNLMMVANAAENILCLLLIAAGMWFIRTLRNSECRVWLAMISFVLTSALIIGNCVPVLGAVVRYKVPALVFLMIAILMPLREKAAGIWSRYVKRRPPEQQMPEAR